MRPKEDFVRRKNSIARVIYKRPALGGFDTSRNSVPDQLKDLFRYRELIKLLTIKEVKLRYKGSFLGFLWSLINPLLMMLVFYLVFTVLLASPPRGCAEGAVPQVAEVTVRGAVNGASLINPAIRPIQAPQIDAVNCRIYNHYPAFILIGILAWNLTGGSIMAGMSSLLGNSNITKKVYFPREIFPIASVLAQLVNFLLALIPLSAVMVLNGVIPSGYILLLPIVIFFHMLFLLGLSMIVSIGILYFRDLGVIMEVLLQAWFFLSPVLYSMQQVYKDGTQLVYWLNPMASFIESYRTILFFDYSPELFFTIRTCLTGLIMFVIGYAFFIYNRKRIGELL